jgi:hypothetical protein
MDSMNIFQIWDSVGRKVPFAVAKDNWSKTYYVIVEEIDCIELPYGKAYGYPTINGKSSNFFITDKRWREHKIIPSAGVYAWLLVDVEIPSSDNT